MKVRKRNKRETKTLNKQLLSIDVRSCERNPNRANEIQFGDQTTLCLTQLFIHFFLNSQGIQLAVSVFHEKKNENKIQSLPNSIGKVKL